MEKIKIIDKQKISGKVAVSGSKNSALALIAACLLKRGRTTLYNCPKIADVFNMIKILKKANVLFHFNCNMLEIDSTNICYIPLKMKEMQMFRASYYLIGAFLALFNKCEFIHPGGCNLGARPIDYHLLGFESLGYNITVKDDVYIVERKSKIGETYFIPNKSVGATINLLLAASLKENDFRIENASCEPEVIDIVEYLKENNMVIEESNNSFVIKPSLFSLKYSKHYVIPDRIEAATFVFMALLCGKLEITNVCIEDMLSVINPLIMHGANIKYGKNKIYVSKSRLNSFNINTDVYPGFPTDAQPMLTALLIFNKASYIIHDEIFENRFNYVGELLKMNARINKNTNYEIQIIPSKISGGIVNAPDLRGAAALLIAALGAGNSEITSFEVIHRGYEDIYNKLKNIGVNFDVEII